jgi:hypothetical protein
MKDFLTLMSTQGFMGEQQGNLQDRIRTQQASGGLLYGGSAARQEASIVGRFQQNKRLSAATQLSSLTEKEHMLPTQITQQLAQTEQSAFRAAVPQLSTPIQSLSQLYGGTSAGIGSIFQLSSLY